jgi:predicted sulfurtransferase
MYACSIEWNSQSCSRRCSERRVRRHPPLSLPIRLVAFSAPDAPSAPTAASEPAADSAAAGSERPPFAIVNFYHLVDFPDPEAVLAAHQAVLDTLDIRGRIWISYQGINCQISGPVSDVEAYQAWVRQQRGFEGFERFNLDPLPPGAGHMFPRLRLKFKKSLISMQGGTLQYRLSDPANRSTPLEPAQWKEMIAEAKQVILGPRGGDEAAASTSAPSSAAADGERKKDYIVLDLRNDVEWDAGHFEGSARPLEAEFKETPTGDRLPAYLQDADPATTNVMMYCTGGIRCDIYSAYLRERGFKNLYSLEGGVHKYIKEVGGDHWKGSLFVFDGRMAVPAGNTTESGQHRGEGGSN